LNNSIKKHFDLLGYEVKDKVSDFKGVVVSVSFDLYGCIQALVRPITLDNNNKIQSGSWLDISRLSVLTKKPLMKTPNFGLKNIINGEKGPANLPSINK